VSRTHRHTYSRRRFLAMAGGAGALVGLGAAGCGVLTTERAGKLLSSRLPLPEPFSVPLPIPAVATPVNGSHYVLTQRPASVEIIPGTRTEIWGFDGTYPGPTFDVRSGEPISVEIVNELPVPTSTHLHGGVTPPEFDGYPTHLVVPAEHADHFDPAAGSHHAGNPADWELSSPSFIHEYPLDQPAATLWYHDHRMDFTGPQVYRGLAGMFIVRDDVDDALPLPKGDKEIPLCIADRAFEEDGSFRYPSVDPTLLHEPGVEGDYHQGVEGDVILVNGAPWPELEVEATRYRFRILNGSNARRYDLRLDPPPPDGDPFVQVGSDVGLLAEPQGLDRVVLASAERADVIIDFGAYPVGTEVTVVNDLDNGSAGQVMRFRIVRDGTDDSAIPDVLADFELLTQRDVVARRTFDFRRTARDGGHQVWTVNGEEFDPALSLANPELGTTEMWTFTSDFHHPVHVHLGHFQVYSRNDGDPGPMDAGWKDTVDIRPYEVVQVLVKFTGFRGRYVMHCHNLEHEDMAMMANFDVI
jgi:spore coat protein A, manganese oxidase